MASVFSVPLSRATKPKLFVRVTTSSDDEEPVSESSFTPLKVETTFDGSMYAKTLNQEDVDTMWESRFTDTEAYRHRYAIITKLLTAKGADIPSGVPEFQLGAIYQEDGSIKVSLRTTDKLPKTMASFYVVNTGTSNSDVFRQWLDDVCSSQKRTSSTVTVQQDDIRNLKAKVLLLEHYNATMEQDYRMIIDDLKAKFSSALAYKKQRIWELMQDKLPTDELFGLNQEYLDRNKKDDVDTFAAAIKRQRTQLTPDDSPKKRKPAPNSKNQPPLVVSSQPRLQIKQEPDDTVWPDPQVKVEPESDADAVVVADDVVVAADVTTDISDAESVATSGSAGTTPAARAASVVEDSQNDTDYGSD